MTELDYKQQGATEQNRVWLQKSFEKTILFIAVFQENKIKLS